MRTITRRASAAGDSELLDSSLQASCLEEPNLIFGSDGRGVDPKAGIAEFGPFGGIVGAGKTVRLGVIGTSDGIQGFTDLLQKAQRGIDPGRNSRGSFADPLTYPRFPPLSGSSAFRAEFLIAVSSHQRVLHEEFFVNAVKGASDEAKIRNVVDLLIGELEAVAQVDPPPDVVVIVLPLCVEHETAHVGASMSRRKEKVSPAEEFRRRLAREAAKTGQASLNLEFDDAEQDTSQVANFNIHHALKARAMSLGIATQLIWESTFRDQYLSSVAWNLFTALYYKAGNIPWQLESLTDDTCFIGIGFYKEKPYAGAGVQSSLAQVFGAGEGIILRGGRAMEQTRFGEKQPHLPKLAAMDLMAAAIGQYEQQHGARPNRVVVHKTSKYGEEELEGFKLGLGGIKNYDFLAIERLGLRFFRLGKNPVVRGTFIPIAARRYLLFTSGYIPFLRAYPGKRVPEPLEIVEHIGNGTAVAVCREILALTKLNWNSSWFGSFEPITIRFARDVGKILREFPASCTAPPQKKYRFFM